MNEVVLIAGMAAVTFAVRYPVLALVGRLELPPRVLAALRFVPTAVLMAIIVPAMLAPAPAGEVSISPTNAYLIAGIFAVFISWRTKNLLLTIVLGMAAFLLWRVVVG